MPDTNEGSSPNAVDVTYTLALWLFKRVTALLTLFAPVAYDSRSTILPPSCLKRMSNAWTTFLK